ncbi:putative fatty acyl-CoA reductase CG5065 [Planococcus citri]|uniref:putative fatty acyl-CoA reductase CG5065 n=1 Tax=Planococcus citri TaxID=170843 RepID=UPI0031FA36B6
MTEESQISQFYAQKKILITGATGFMGKVLLWKLLHSCSQLDTIFVLMRSKHGKSSMSRNTEFFNSPAFENLKKDNPKVFEKVVLISGDVGEDGIGLSDLDRGILIDEVSVVFHSAAIIKMNMDLRTVLNVNTVGTARMLELAQQMKKLESFVYLSTAYCCCENPTVEERMYPSNHNPNNIIDLIKWIEPKLLEKITPGLIHPLPNTYTYSKRLTESMLHDYVSKVPIIVARPSIVGPCFKEPFPGWSDSINGPMGFYVAGGRGVMRTTTMNLDSKANMIPADISINSIIILPWANSREQLLKEVGVYNISQNSFENVTWRELLHTCMRALAKYPLDIMLWYPNTDPATKSMFVYTIKCIFLHYLPAYVIDFILLLAGQKQFLVRAHDKLRQGEKMLRLFTQKEWLFKHDKILQLEQLMNPIDRQIFPVNTKEMQDVQSYTDDCMLSAKFHIFREDLKHRKRSKIIMNIMYALDKIVLVLRYYILGKFLLFIFNTLWSIFNRAEDMPSY